MYTIYHNPRCSKSRAALELLKEMKVEHQIIDYQKDMPSAKELESVLTKLGMNAYELIRKHEAEFKNDYADREFSNKQWINILLKHPKLIERPIVIKGDKAVIARPAELINSL